MDRVHQLCRTFRQFGGADLALYESILFTVNVELNTLLSRNKNLRPSDLIKDNLVFLAKSAEASAVNRILINDDKLAINPKTFINNEVFIVTLTLKVLNFTVAPAVSIEFLKDENYGILVLCDYNFILRIEQYIVKLFTNIIDMNLQQDTHEINLSQDISGTETTLEISEHELSDYSDDDTLIHERIKQPIPEEDFIGDMNNLRHNDGEMNGGMRVDVSSQESDRLAIKLDDLNLSPVETKEVTASEPAQILPDSPILPHSPAQSPTQSPTKQPQPPQTLPQPFDQNVFDLEDSKPEFAIKLKHSTHNVNHHQPVTEDFQLPTKKLSRTFIPPPKPKKLSSFSIDLHDFDNLDPDAAYYKGVKGDKKFKFIKVGKVQKFVNLFEEKLHEETDSVSTTRTGTRPASRAGTRPTSTAGTRPTSNAGTRPPSHSGTRPSSRASNFHTLESLV